MDSGNGFVGSMDPGKGLVGYTEGCLDPRNGSVGGLDPGNRSVGCLEGYLDPGKGLVMLGGMLRGMLASWERAGGMLGSREQAGGMLGGMLGSREAPCPARPLLPPAGPAAPGWGSG